MSDIHALPVRVAFFDLDRTLIDCNSGHLWLRQEWRDGRISVRDAAWAVGVLGLYGLGIGDMESAFSSAVATLKGEEEERIAIRTRVWFAEQVRHRIRPGAISALDAHRRAGHHLVVATTSSVYAAQEAASAYGLQDIVCSRFEVKDGVFTGKLASSAYGANKLRRAEEWAATHGIPLAECAFYTDSVSDVTLLEQVGYPAVVHPDRKLRQIALQRRWPILDWGVSATEVVKANVA